MTLLKQNIIRKKQANKLLKLEPEFNVEKNKKYKVTIIQDNVIYTKLAENQLSKLYYLVFWTSFLEDRSIEELASAIMRLQKMISTFHKHYLEKSTSMSLCLNSVSPIIRLLVKPTIKQKQADLLYQVSKLKKLNSGPFNFRKERFIHFLCSLHSKERLRLHS